MDKAIDDEGPEKSEAPHVPEIVETVGVMLRRPVERRKGRGDIVSRFFTPDDTTSVIVSQTCPILKIHHTRELVKAVRWCFHW